MPGPPDSEVSARPVGGPALVYPESMIEQEREGSADIECTILPDGHTTNCVLVGTTGGGTAFGRAAMAYVGSAQYKPAFRNGKPITEEHHRLHIVFHLTK